MRRAGSSMRVQAEILFEGDQPPADRHRGGAEYLAVAEQREFRGAAADVDTEHGIFLAPGQGHRAGTVGGHHRFHIMAGAGADELAALGGEQVGDFTRIAPLQRFAGQDHRAAVDVLAPQPGLGIGLIEKTLQRVGVDGVVGPVRREKDRRAPEDLAPDNDEAAGERFR